MARPHKFNDMRRNGLEYRKPSTLICHVKIHWGREKPAYADGIVGAGHNM